MKEMEDLKAYIDGEVSPERREEIEREMATDPRLQREIEELRVLSRLIGEGVMQPEPTGLERTLSLLAARERKPKPVFGKWFLALGAVCASVLMIAIFFPVFAQSKMAASDAVMMSEAKRAQAESDMEAADAPARPQTTGQGAATFGDNSVAGGGFRGRAERSKTEGRAEAYRPMSDGAGAPGPQQLLIRTGDITIRVEKVQSAQESVVSLAKSLGGFVESSSVSSDEYSLPTANLVIRVPEKTFDSAMKRLAGLGEVRSQSTTGQDVTAQVADVEARMKVMKAEEESYVTMLRAARKVGELLEIKERLSSVRQEIESLDAQRKVLRNQATYSTISVSMEQIRQAGQPEPSKGWFDEAWAEAVTRGAAFFRWLATVGLNLVIFAPLWLPVVAIAIWYRRRYR